MKTIFNSNKKILIITFILIIVFIIALCSVQKYNDYQVSKYNHMYIETIKMIQQNTVQLINIENIIDNYYSETGKLNKSYKDIYNFSEYELSISTDEEIKHSISELQEIKFKSNTHYYNFEILISLYKIYHSHIDKVNNPLSKIPPSNSSGMLFIWRDSSKNDVEQFIDGMMDEDYNLYINMIITE